MKGDWFISLLFPEKDCHWTQGFSAQNGANVRSWPKVDS